ncbi:hypothetical protein VCUG_02266 [Vavraia culicis subsp. floridensis]|uniref:Uncharacterized protein n=1 Tax=Vavraia culicis (isolate floridensis) TaxID=948595 RepID=L2GSA5_VAVCU|nr:uncharacterized protein VCUG_02266 [Vavraia culicis subsp. floridensis]ELA46257.1 hypothetical protein VCUG_02266 [Vavraia culicis subsp. floridensis]
MFGIDYLFKEWSEEEFKGEIVVMSYEKHIYFGLKAICHAITKYCSFLTSKNQDYNSCAYSMKVLDLSDERATQGYYEKIAARGKMLKHLNSEIHECWYGEPTVVTEECGEYSVSTVTFLCMILILGLVMGFFFYHLKRRKDELLVMETVLDEMWSEESDESDEDGSILIHPKNVHVRRIYEYQSDEMGYCSSSNM